MGDQKHEQRKSEQEAAHAAAARQEEQSRPGGGERHYSPSPQDREGRAGVVPTSGPLVYIEEGGPGQHPYTYPPPMAERRFYEDPVPAGAATEQQILQGRGAPPPAPTHMVDRPWDPRRYPDQLETMRPVDSPQPSEYEANSTMTLAAFAALPQQQQDKILAELRKTVPGRPPEYQPTRVTVEEQDRRAQEADRLRRDADRREGERLSMGPATPGTVTSG